MSQVTKKDILKIITSILDIDQKLTGIDYLKEFIKNIALNLDVKYALIGHPTGDSLSELKTDVVWAVNDFADNFVYELKDTPCELVLTGERVCIHDKNVIKDFPDDKLLQDMGIEAYIGAPVVSRTKTGVSSILVLLDDKAMQDKDFFVSIVDFLALRASAEITQHYIEESLQNKVEERTLELKKAKTEIEKINKNLEKRIKEEINENKVKQEIIFHQSKMAAMGEMIENIAHQWRQPLSVISTSATGLILKTEIQTVNNEEIVNTMECINNHTQYLSQTIDDFRKFFSITKEKNTFCLKDTIKKVFKLLSSEFVNSNIIIIENTQELCILSYEYELIQVLINILNNAKDQLFEKDIKEKYIFIDIKVKENIEISIKDNAGGIPGNLIHKIFKQHFTTKAKQNGTGIGLYMSNMIIKKNLKGTIEVSNQKFTYQNTEYNGAEFKIILPHKI
ncbi:MAG: hypothetical protein COA66_04110 [Arcobacter sp.]|nr:MAG: hypothetical protein COA66_04110 [Arcobacter sp.]